MSTNYYLHRDFCKCCGKPKEILHICKISAGWKPLFQYQEELKKFEELEKLLDSGNIKDEYDTDLSKAQFMRLLIEFQQNRPREIVNINDGIFIDRYKDEDYEFCRFEFT